LDGLFLPLALDLRDAAACESALAPHRDATHLVYAALQEQSSLVKGWLQPEHVETNAAMLRNCLDGLAGGALRHVTLLQGTKAYGAHLGRPIRVPAREREPRLEHPNFYFAQEDLLQERAARDGFAWTILRPQIVLGVASGSAMNVAASLAGFALLSRELGRALSHPGHEHALAECTDARLLARAIEWAESTPAAAGETYNVTNGDVIAWRDLFPALARFFGMELGPPAPLRPSEEMPRHAGLWREIACREGLVEPDLERWIGLSWQYADALWANPRLPERPALVSGIKLRQAGFPGCVDTEDGLFEILREMRRLRYIPRR
jgi:nucleoside-diphosphate-sugar epimerase